MTEFPTIPPTRGERNANPGNVEFMPSTAFHGQLGLEYVPPGESFKPVYGRYDTPANGVRALAKLLLNDQRIRGLDTVAQYLGVETDQAIDVQDPETHEMLVYAIITQENGRCLYDALDIARACSAARAS